MEYYWGGSQQVMSCEPTKILLKCACGQENVVQLGDMSRGFGRHADG